MATPVFDGASEEEIREMLALADLPETGQADLYDGVLAAFRSPGDRGLYVHAKAQPSGG